MITLNQSEIGTVLDVKMNDQVVKETVAENLSMILKKKLASS